MLALFVIIAQTGCVQDMVGGWRDLDVIGNLEIAEMFDELPRLGWMWWCCHCGRLGVNRKWWRDLAPTCSLYTSSNIFQHPPSSIRRQDAEVLRRYMFPSFRLVRDFLIFLSLTFPCRLHGKYTAGIAAINRVLASRLLLFLLLPRHSRPFSALQHKNNDTSHRRESYLHPSPRPGISV